MEVIIKENKNIKPSIKVGDIIVYDSSNCAPCIVTKTEKDGEFAGISLDGICTFSGYRSTLEHMQKYVDNGEATLYKQEEWELVLQRKSL